MTEKKTSELSFTKQSILWAVSGAHLTAEQISKQLGVHRSAINENLRELRNSGLVYISGEVQTTGRKAPLYASFKQHEKPSKHFGGRDGKPSPTRLAVCNALAIQPMTMREIVQFTGLSMSKVNGCIMHWREVSGNKVFRISRWQYEEGQGVGYLPVWALSPGGDAEKPSVSRKERDQRWRERNRAIIRARGAMDRAKAKGEQVEVNPFAQLLRVTGSTLVAAKQKAKIKAEEVEAA